MRQGAQNRQIALVGVVLAAIGLASAFFAREVSRRLVPPPAARPASVARPVSVPAPVSSPGPVRAALPGPPPRQEPAGAAAPEMTIQVKGDANTITLHPSDFVGKEPGCTVDGDGGTSVFLVGPQQTARVELLGDGNTVHVPEDLKDRVTVVNNGSANNVAD